MKNWAGNLNYSSAVVARPESAAELAQVVARAGRVKALGSRHSFNRIADTDGVHVLLDALPQHIELDSERQTVRVSGAVSYGALCRTLQQVRYGHPQSGVTAPHFRGRGSPDWHPWLRREQPLPGRSGGGN